MTDNNDRLTEILRRLVTLEEATQHRLALLERAERAQGDGVNIFQGGGKSSPAATVRPREGMVLRVLQTLHATFQAGWWESADGSRASFSQLAGQVLAPMGVTPHYIRQYLSRAYDQQNWYDFVADIDREARRYKRRKDSR